MIQNFHLNKRLLSVFSFAQSAIQVLLFVTILVFLGVAWWRYHNTVFVLSEPRVESTIAISHDEGFQNIQPVTFYADLAEQRDIFRFTQPDQLSSVAVVQSSVLVDQDLMGRYVLQGIVLDGHPMAIIKDIQTNKTHFLHRLEFLEGAKLVEIISNRVIFDRDGVKQELIKK